MATRMADSPAGLGISPSQAVNHVSGLQAGIAGIYNRLTCAAEKCAAPLSQAPRLIMAQANGENVVPMRRAENSPLVYDANRRASWGAEPQRGRIRHWRGESIRPLTQTLMPTMSAGACHIVQNAQPDYG